MWFASLFFLVFRTVTNLVFIVIKISLFFYQSWFTYMQNKNVMVKSLKYPQINFTILNIRLTVFKKLRKGKA